jgi:hypothetical protein
MHSVCTHLDFKVEKAHLEVELMTLKWYNFGDLGYYTLVVSKEFFKRTEGIPGFEECVERLVEFPENTMGNWRQVNFQEDRFDHSEELKRLWCRLVELPKNPSVARCKDLQEGRRHSKV